MYRQQKRMAIVPEAANPLRLRFVERIVSLPAVNIACNAAFQTYKGIKASNTFLDATLNTAEKAGNFVTQRSIIPVIKRFENQIKVVDDVACRGLDNLVVIAPVITKEPDQVISYSKNRCNEAIQNNLNKLTTSKNYVKGLVDAEIQKRLAFLTIVLSRTPGQRVLQLSEHTLDLFEAFLNNYYPPQEEESEEPAASETNPPPWERAAKLATTLEKRVSAKLEHDLQTVRQFASNTYSNIANFDLTKCVDEFLSSPYGVLFLSSVDTAFDHAENCVNHYLPPLGDEGGDQPFGDREIVPTWRRADMLSNTLRERVYKHSLLGLQKIQMQSRETAGLIRNMDMVQFMSSFNLTASAILAGSSEYASSFVQLAFSFSVTASQSRQPIAKLRDLAHDVVETARNIHRILFVEGIIFPIPFPVFIFEHPEL